MSKSKVPQIRFKGFIGEWKESELGKKVEFFTGLTYSPNNVVKDNGTLVLRSSNVKDGQIIDADNVYVNSNVVNCSNVLKGDIAVVVRNGSRSLIGKHAQIQKEMNNTVIGAFMTGIRSEQPSFINALLDSPKFYKEIEKNLGATINQITTGAFKKMIFSFSEESEQTKIGDYFQQLDKLIQQKEKKYQKLKQFKKAMLDKMFPKNGADAPEIRFKGFSGKWEEKRLEEIALIKTGYPFDSNKFDANGEYLVITNGNIQNDFSFVDNLLGNKINIEDKCSLTEYILNLNDILVTMDGTVGRVAKVIHEKQILAQRVGRIISLIDSDFVYYFLSTGDFFKKMKLISTGGTIKHISLNDISKYESYIPKDFEEQKKIGDYFQKLDKQIELQQKELEKLKNIKKASLSKMFV